MLKSTGFAVSIVVAIICSDVEAQAVVHTDWLSGLYANIDALNRNIQQNVQQLNRRIQETVRDNLAQVQETTKNLNKDIAAGGPIQTVGGQNVILTNNDGTKIVQSGRTSDGKPYIRESTEKIVGDTLRHVERVYDPTGNVTKTYGYTLDLKDPNAKAVPIKDTA